MATISQAATPEKGTRIITLAPTDENGTALGIGDLINPVWTLTTKRHNSVVNSRSNVSLLTLYVVLTGDDLAITDNDLWRVVTIEARYNSSTYGAGLYLKEQYEFPIEDLDWVA